MFQIAAIPDAAEFTLIFLGHDHDQKLWPSLLDWLWAYLVLICGPHPDIEKNIAEKIVLIAHRLIAPIDHIFFFWSPKQHTDYRPNPGFMDFCKYKGAVDGQNMKIL